MPIDFEYESAEEAACPAQWGFSPSKPMHTLLWDWGLEDLIGTDDSADALETWYVKAHGTAVAKVSVATAEMPGLRERFLTLAREWVRETEKHSNLMKIVMHPAYQQIIAMGPCVIPEILRLMMKGSDHWFWALQALTQGQDPAEGTQTIDEASAAWIKWGRERYDLD